jgi:hypothetical protein
VSALEDKAAVEIADAYLAVTGRPLNGDTGSYLAAAAEFEPPYDGGELIDDRYEQRAEDDRIGEMFGHEPGARRRI